MRKPVYALLSRSQGLASSNMASLKTYILCLLHLSLSLGKPSSSLQALIPSSGDSHKSTILPPFSNISESDLALPIEITLLRRENEYGEWTAHPHSLIVPSCIAAATLDCFYDIVLKSAIQEWAYLPSMKHFGIEWGNLRLAFDSFGRPIPWDIVARIALRLRSATPLEWTATSENLYTNQAVTHGVSVSLQILDGRPKKSGHADSFDDLPHQVTPSPRKRNGHIKHSALTYSRVYGVVVPMSLASQRFRDFFTAIAQKASNEWSLGPEDPLFTLTQGPLQLTVSCLGGNVPWPFLAIAAEKFSTLVDHQFVSTFDAFFTEVTSNIVVGFSLRLLRDFTGRSTEGAMRLSGPSPRSLEQPSSPAKSSVLSERLSNRSPSLKMTKFRPMQVTALVPTVIAAARLEEFYEIIALKIETGYFKNWAPSKNIILDLFEFELQFSCDRINIPWSVVQAFVLDMAELSSKQFSGLYEATIRGDGPLTNLVFYVYMRLREDLQQRPQGT